MRSRLRPTVGRAWRATSQEATLLLRAARLDADDVQAIRDRRLRATLRHAAMHSRGWRQRLAESGVVIDRRVVLDRFEQLPPLARRELASDHHRFEIEDLSRRHAYRNTSGGSTGEPVEFVQDRNYLRWTRAVKATFDAFTGYVAGQPKFVIWGAASRDTSRHPPLSTRLRHWGKHETWVDAYRMEPAVMGRWAGIVNELRPVQILGYAESLDVWAQFLLDEAIRIRPPRAVMATAGTLNQQMRDTIEAGLGAPVFDRYGSREVSDIACETSRHDGLVIAPLHVHVEIVGTDGTPLGPGEEGEVLVTSLTNAAMPLLRYRIGDRAVWDSDPRDARTWQRRDVQQSPSLLVPVAWPRLARVTGRVTEHFVAADGALVHAGALRTRLYGIKGIRSYQLVQHTPTRVEVLIAVEDDDSAEVIPEIEGRLGPALAELLRGRIDLEVSRVADIEVPPSGKHRHTRCLVADVDERSAPSRDHSDRSEGR